MSSLKIITYGNPVLRKKAEPVKKIDEKIKIIADSMVETMRAQKGVGLAANQVGILEQICVIDISRGEDKNSLFVLINPVVSEKNGKRKFEEGCLSFPEIFGEVERALKIKVNALNLNGEKIELEAENILARVLQHEIDHLNGVLFIDYLSFVRKLEIQKKLKELKNTYKKKKNTTNEKNE